MTPSFVILTGASASGKTTLAQYFLKHPECEVFFFDSIGVPPVEKMEARYGSAEAWQRAMIFQWIGRIRPVLSAQRPVLFEGQMRIAFIKEALAAHEIASAHIILLDCDDVTRTAKLDRSQPDLASPIMINWARHLRAEARELGVEVLDTSHTHFDHCISHLRFCPFGEPAGE